MFANCWSQFLLDRLGRYLNLFVSTVGPSSHEFASQFGIAIVMGKKDPQTIAVTELPARVLRWMNQRPVTVDHQRPVEKERYLRSRLINSDPSNGDKLNGDRCGGSVDKLSQNGDKAIKSKRRQREFIYTFTAWIFWFRDYYVAHAFVVCRA